MAQKTGTCPVCNGTTRVPYTGKYAHITAGYDESTGTVPCGNCGGQYMDMTATGVVALRPDGTPCTHAYQETGSADRRRFGWHEYTCAHCGDAHFIDSGD